MSRTTTIPLQSDSKITISSDGTITVVSGKSPSHVPTLTSHMIPTSVYPLCLCKLSRLQLAGLLGAGIILYEHFGCKYNVQLRPSVILEWCSANTQNFFKFIGTCIYKFVNHLNNNLFHTLSDIFIPIGKIIGAPLEIVHQYEREINLTYYNHPIPHNTMILLLSVAIICGYSSPFVCLAVQYIKMKGY